ncbi:hypothetical protein [Tardiphaga robiniae]|uniref:Uncharacterized protein n=1 Tax=Tardiphaga robiniae TaxID=943830 RepID=A0A7G6U2B9_9BRAD|nr:hypothetical protein [Tardiphaga robiniae]QND73151.1 hypothetical protein HB776_19515 [Tardiphaga robiniae]
MGWLQISTTVLAASALATEAVAQRSKLTAADLRCYSDQSCRELIGLKVWGARNISELCEEVNPVGRCRKLPVGTAMTIEAVTGTGLLDTFFLMKLADGRTGFVRTANAHLLTLVDPKPAQEAAKKRQIETTEKAKEQEAADAATLAATPKADLDKGCILAAAERLPRIPGIQIGATKTADLPVEYKPSPGVYMTMVEIAAKAAGQDATYSFLCAKSVRGPTLVTPLSQR